MVEHPSYPPSPRFALTRVLLWGLFLGSVIYGLMVPFFGVDRLLRAGYTATLLALSGVGFLFLRYRRDRLAGGLAVLGVTAVLASALFNPDGTPVVYAGFVVGVVMVALLYGTRWGLLYGIGAFAMGFYPMVLRGEVPHHISPWNDWMGYGVYFIVTALLTGFAVRSLERARENEIKEVLSRQSVEHALATRQVQMGLVFEASDAAAWEWNGSDRRLRWVGPAKKLLGLSAEPETLPDLMARVSPEDRPGLAAWFASPGAGPTTFVHEFRHMDLEGGTHWFETRGRVERAEGGEPSRILATLVGIDHRKVREEIAKREENLIRDLVSDMEVGLISFDGDLRPNIWNTRAGEWLGEPDGLAGFWMIPLEGEDGNPILADRNPVRLCLRGGEPVSGIFRRRDTQPPGPWLAFRCDLKHLSRGGGPGVILTLQDISRLRGMERALQETERSWFSLLADIPDHILSLDPSGRILWTNRKGGDGSSSPTGHLRGWLPGETVAELSAALGKAFAGGASLGLECEGPGGVRWQCHLSPVERGGTVVACFLFARDISRGYVAEAALRESRQLLRIAFEANPDGLALIGPDGLVRDFNPRLTELTARPDFAAVHWADLASPGERGAILEAMGRLLRGESQVERSERKWEGADGATRWVKERLSPVRDGAGVTVALMAQAEDITTPRHAARSIADSEGRLRLMVEGLPFGLHLYQREDSGRVILTGFNPVAERLLDMDHGGFPGRALGEVLGELDHPAIRGAMDRVFTHGSCETIPEWAWNRHGVAGAFQLHLFPLGEKRLALLFQDIKDMRQGEKANLDRLKQLEGALSALPAVHLLLDDRGRILEGNPDALARFAPGGESLAGMAFPDLLIPDGNARWETMAHVLSSGRTLDLESELKGCGWFRMRVKRQSSGHITVLAVPRFEKTLRPAGTETGGSDGLRDELARQFRDGESPVFCLVLLELERYREVDEALGGEMAEGLFSRAWEILSPMAQEAGASLYRAAPACLAVVVPGATALEGQRLSAKWVAALSDPWKAGTQVLEGSTFAAVAASPDHGQDPQVLLRAARRALRHGREEGLPVTTYRHDLDRGIPRRRRILADLPGALERGEFHLDAQGAFALPLGASPKAVWVELFLRWKHPHGGDLGPGEFIPLAAWSGLSIPMAEMMFRLGSRALSSWNRNGYRGHLHFNLGEHLACDMGLPEYLERWCAEGNLDPRRVGLEIPEWAVARDPLHSATVMERLSRRGHPIWLDDYGVHPLPFPRLADLDLAGIKLAPALTRGLPGNGRLRALVTSLSLTCRSLDLTLCAKGVEDPDTIPLLASLGVDRIQGHATGVPQPVGPTPP